MLPTLAGAYTSTDNLAFIDALTSRSETLSHWHRRGRYPGGNINAFGTNSRFETQGNAIVSIGNGLGGTY